MEIPEKIICVDCGQPCYRLSFAPEDGWQIGDYVAYRCSGCNDRWDVVVADPDEPTPQSELSEAARAIFESRKAES